MTTPSLSDSHDIKKRFRGFLPVVVDVETGGFDCQKHALLEIAAIIPHMDEEGWIHAPDAISTHVVPFEGSELDPKAMEVNGIKVNSPLRAALPEREALNLIFKPIRAALRNSGCQRAVLVGHNAHFDLSFINAVVARTGYKRNPFHPFSCFDTATLGGLAYGQTVLSRAVQAAGLDWNADDAHSASYDTERTARLFCGIVNRWKRLQDLEKQHGSPDS
ncbi:MAG: ribonuclease T [Rhodanobacteraceae bacterium]